MVLGVAPGNTASASSHTNTKSGTSHTASTRPNQVLTRDNRTPYDVWFRLGWRPSEILALGFDWLDFERQTAHIRRGRIARWGGLEAPPKTGERKVD
jgi:hypothetical protein